MSNFHTHYDTLMVHRQAPVEVIKAAYQTLVQKYQLERNAGNPEVIRFMAQLNDAYAVLSSSAKRADYDRWLDAQVLKQPHVQQKSQPQPKARKFFPAVLIVSLLAFTGMVMVIAQDIYSEKPASIPAEDTTQAVGPDSPATVPHVAPSPVDAAVPASEPVAAEPLPLTGDTDTPDLQGVAPLQIKVSQGNHYLVKVEDAYSHVALASFFIRSGETLNTKIPVGNYVIKYAYGQQWYGLDHLFGAGTAYAKADDIFNFTFTGNGYSGHTIELILQSNGNLETSNISPSQF